MSLMSATIQILVVIKMSSLVLVSIAMTIIRKATSRSSHLEMNATTSSHNNNMTVLKSMIANWVSYDGEAKKFTKLMSGSREQPLLASP